jgi:hypothetical protein
LFCIGAPKAGTTWLYDHLSGHPDCHLRRIKELHYFDTLDDGSLAKRATALRRGRKGSAGRRGKASDMTDWLEVLDLGREDTGAYLAYLTDGLGDRRLVADITPAYSLLSAERLRMMAGLMPDVRFLYLMRDPVDRLWSHAKMMANRATEAEAEVPGLARQFLADLFAGRGKVRTWRLDYRAAIERLTEAVAPERRMVAFHDEVITTAGMAGLWSFLGIGAGPVDPEKRVFTGKPLAMHPDDAAAARRYLAPQYDFVAGLFGRLPDSWHRHDRAVAA